MEFSSWKTYAAMIGGVGIVVAAAIAIFLVFDPTSGSAQPVSSAYASQSGANSRVQQTPVKSPAVISTVAPTNVPKVVSTKQPTVTYFVPPDADQSVKDILADGVVTLDEYTQAVNNDMACLDSKGITHTDPVYDQSKGQFNYSIVSSTGPTDGLSPEDECWMRYERDVQSAWVQTNQANIKPVIVDATGALQCAAQLGIDARTIDELQAQKQAHPADPIITHCWDIATIGYDPSGDRVP